MQLLPKQIEIWNQYVILQTFGFKIRVNNVQGQMNTGYDVILAYAIKH